MYILYVQHNTHAQISSFLYYATHYLLLFSGHLHFYFPDVYTYTIVCAHKIMSWLVRSAPGLGDLSLVLEPTW